MARTGRPKKEFNKKTFEDLIGFNMDEKDICWFFRDETGKPANVDTLSRWCVREYGVTFQEYKKQNGGSAMRIKLIQNQMRLSEKSAAMAIWLGKNYLNQRDRDIADAMDRSNGVLESLMALHKQNDNVE
jgi:hypothetical protein